MLRTQGETCQAEFQTQMGTAKVQGSCETSRGSSCLRETWTPSFTSKKFSAQPCFPSSRQHFLTATDSNKTTTRNTSRLAKEFMESSGIHWWKTPPESPDLNPIETLWHELKHFLQTIVKLTTKEQLLKGIMGFWRERVTAAKCMTYINHFKKVVLIVIQSEGHASGH